MRIVIPTKGKFIKDLTIDACVAQSVYPVTLVVPESERDYWKGYDVVTVPDAFHCGQTRTFIFHCFKETKHIVPDDDLVFFKRHPGNKLRRTNDILELFQDVDKVLDDYAHGAISVRGYNNLVYPQSYTECGKAIRFNFYAADVIRAEGISLEDFPICNDIEFTLSLIELGYINWIGYEWSCDQPQRGFVGGCQVYRTEELFEKMNKVFIDKHPQCHLATKKMTYNSVVDNTVTERKMIAIPWKKSLGIKSNLRRAQ
jgi:hypothetical protein